MSFIHTATLLHDDVVDISALRRGRPTANAEFGNAPSVLVGDFLYTRAFQLMVKTRQSGTFLAHMADTTNIIAEGEVLQLVRAGQADTSQSQYLDVITRKTAILFAAACYGAATLAGADVATRESLRDYGLKPGHKRFQMIDDVLDYEGDPENDWQKNVGDDPQRGQGDPATDSCVADRFTQPVRHDPRGLLPKKSKRPDRHHRYHGARLWFPSKYTREQAGGYHAKALASLDALPPSAAKDSLKAIAALSLDRDH